MFRSSGQEWIVLTPGSVLEKTACLCGWQTLLFRSEWHFYGFVISMISTLLQLKIYRVNGILLLEYDITIQKCGANIFSHKNALNWSKATNTLNKKTVQTNIFSSTTVYNIDNNNNNSFLSSKQKKNPS